jgi:uncharacterized membrane protein YfcA
MTLVQGLILFFAAIVAGALNSVAGGGSFITFPSLMQFGGVPSDRANATNTLALWPGSLASVGAYRNELTTQRRTLLILMIVSLIGGFLGSELLIRTSRETFDKVFPFLLFFAAILFTYGSSLSKQLRAHTKESKAPFWLISGLVLILQLVVAIYGGYFGGGIGIMMLALLSLMGMENIHNMNALKTVLATCINGVAMLNFIAKGYIYWNFGLLMVVGAIIGGYGGAYYAQKIDPKQVRKFVIVIAFSMTAYYFLKQYFGLFQ